MSRVKGSKKTGGRKTGGKNKKTIKQEIALGFLRDEIRKHFPELIRNKIELGRGIWVEKLVKIGKQTFKGRVFQKEPDGKAIDDLFDRVVGKPKQLVDLGDNFPATIIINIVSEEVEKAKKRIKAKRKNEV